ncbi:MAG: CRISPR system precrRNA processing endoribonuclease RAMP protein Cas6 [Thermodesulfobacteriota bacterium]
MVESDDKIVPFLSYARFCFHLRVKTLMVLPPYKGAVFRGAFGNALRRLVCVAKGAPCDSCLLRQKCLYIALFEPSPPPDFLDAGKFLQAPRPYVLNPPLTTRQAFHPGETLDFELVLIGPAIDALPYFIHIFQEVGRRGLGPERGKYELVGVDHLQKGGNGETLCVFDGPSGNFNNFTLTPDSLALSGDAEVKKVTLNFLTPLRLRENGKLVTRLTSSLFFRRLAQRVSLLTAFYGEKGWGLSLTDPGTLLTKGNNLTIQDDRLRWYDWERYSQRQGDTLKFGGLQGMLSFKGRLESFLPYLRLGEYVNVGQGTTFGLGRYEINYERNPDN